MMRLALISGDGDLPFEIAHAQQNPPLICGLDNRTPRGLAVDFWFDLSRLVPFLNDLKAQGVTHVCMAGAFDRPQLAPEDFDPETARLLPDLAKAIASGDDGALRWVISVFETHGFTVLGVADLAPQLLAPFGILSARAPSPAERADAARGLEILRALSPVDVGQGCAVCAGQCLGIEVLFGTGIALGNIATNRPEREPNCGGVYVKRAKTGQDLRVDLPTIGPETIDQLLGAQLTGLCIQANHVVIVDRETTLEKANAGGLSIWAEP